MTTETKAPDPGDGFDPREARVSFTVLKQMARSPAHYLHALRYGSGRESKALRVGQIAHHGALGPGHRGGFAVYEGDRRGNAWKDFKAANPGVPIMTRKEVDQANVIVESVIAHEGAMSLIRGAGAELEREVLWTHPTGRQMISHIDISAPGYTADLKTCGDASADRFVWRSTKAGTHAQLAMYADAHEAERGKPCPASFVIAVEQARPHPVSIFRLTEGALDQGRRLYRSWLERLAVCEATNHFPGYAQSVLSFDVEDSAAFELEFTDDPTTSEGG